MTIADLPVLTGEEVRLALIAALCPDTGKLRAAVEKILKQYGARVQVEVGPLSGLTIRVQSDQNGRSFEGTYCFCSAFHGTFVASESCEHRRIHHSGT